MMIDKEKMEFIDTCKKIVLKNHSGQVNILAYLRTKDESLKDNFFFSDGIINIWLSKDNQTLYVRAIYPEVNLLVYINTHENIEIMEDAIKYQFSHVHGLLGEGLITVYVCPLCKKGNSPKEWDTSTLEPARGRMMVGYKSIMFEKENETYRCPTCKSSSLKKNIELETKEL